MFGETLIPCYFVFFISNVDLSARFHVALNALGDEWSNSFFNKLGRFEEVVEGEGAIGFELWFSEGLGIYKHCLHLFLGNAVVGDDLLVALDFRCGSNLLEAFDLLVFEKVIVSGGALDMVSTVAEFHSELHVILVVSNIFDLHML